MMISIGVPDKIASITSYKQQILSSNIKEIVLKCATNMSYRFLEYVSKEIVNFKGFEGFKYRTVDDLVLREGTSIELKDKQAAEDFLFNYGFDVCTLNPVKEIKYNNGENLLSNSILDKDIIDKINEYREDYEKIDINKLYEVEESVDDSVYVCIDGVLVKKQKEQRQCIEEDKEQEKSQSPRPSIQTYCANIKYGGTMIELCGKTLDQLMPLVLSYVLSRGIQDKNLIFITDGEKAIKNKISEVFKFLKYQYILDWYHIVKSVKEHASMSIKGNKEFKDEFLKRIIRCLWTNRVESAIELLKKLPKEHVKDDSRITNFIGYLERKKCDMTCYAYRRAKQLPISSNSVERTNYRLVARRQKHKGMSWSRGGNFALATVTMADCNNLLSLWSHSRISPLEYALTMAF